MPERLLQYDVLNFTRTFYAKLMCVALSSLCSEACGGSDDSRADGSRFEAGNGTNTEGGTGNGYDGGTAPQYAEPDATLYEVSPQNYSLSDVLATGPTPAHGEAGWSGLAGPLTDCESGFILF